MPDDNADVLRVTKPMTHHAADGSTSTVMVELLGVVVDTRTGEWCNQCALPSVVELDVNWVIASTLAPAGRWFYAECLDCGDHVARER
jgi:hypothetical protein